MAGLPACGQAACNSVASRALFTHHNSAAQRVKVRVLVYGDSNSWGYLDDGSGQRHDGRWPVVMANSLAARGHAIELIEECLPGRTTNADDPEGPTGTPSLLNGAVPLPAILLSQQPLAHILRMLGTNDMKLRFARDAAAITAGIMALAKIIRTVPAGHGGWDGTEPAPLTFICPPRLGARADEPDWIRFDEWRGGRTASVDLPAVLEPACADAGIGFIDGNDHAVSSPLDPIHWSAATHERFGAGIAGYLADRLASAA